MAHPDNNIDPIAVEITNEMNREAMNERRRLLKLQRESKRQHQQQQQKNQGSSEGNDENKDTSLSQVKIRVYTGHKDGIKTCQLCFNDQRIFTSSFDKSVKLWDFHTGSIIRSYEGGHDMYINAAHMNPGNDRFVTAGWDKVLHLWDVETGNILWSDEHNGIVTSCKFSNDGKYVVSASDLDYKVKMFDTRLGAEPIHEIKNLHLSSVTSCGFSPKDDRIVTSSMDKTTKFWDIRSCQNTISLQGHDNVISDWSLRQDERSLATASWDKKIQVWDISTGMYRSEGPVTLKKGHEGCVSCCEFSSDGMLLVSASYDQSVVVWDMENNMMKLKLQGHTDWVEDVCLSRDQKWIVTCSKDRTLRLWDIENTESLPVVLENKKSIGLKISTCHECGKPFSMSQAESDHITLCVFCRLELRQKKSNRKPKLPMK